MEHKVVELFPLPPDYYLLAEEHPQLLQIPPVEPQESYEMFGAKYLIEEPLPLLPDTERLFDKDAVPSDITSYKQVHLTSEQVKSIIQQVRQLHQSMDSTYLELLDALITCPDRQAQLVDRLKLIAVNIHYLMNTYLRPLQARSDLHRLKQAKIQELQQFITEGKQLNK